MAVFVQDLCYGIRQIRRSPGFFSIAALLIAIGIAAATQIFTLVNALLLRPLPVSDPQSLVQLFELQPKRPAEPFFDYRFYRLLGRETSTLFRLSGQIDTTRSLELKAQAPQRIHVVGVTPDYFTDLGIVPAVGRVFGGVDDHVTVLSFAIWSRSFGRDPNVAGQVVRLQGHPYTIVGVAPPEFTGTTVDSSPDVWIPLANQLDFSRSPNASLDQYSLEIIARLRAGVSLSQAQQEVSSLWNRYMEDAARSDPGSYQGLKRGLLEVQSITHGVSPIREQSRTALVLLLAGTGLLLLMVCANVGGLLLSRATAGERELAVRLALGASRGRIVRQWLIESGFLIGIGGCAGVALGYAGLPLLKYWMPPAHGIGFDPGEIRTLALNLSFDFRVAAFVVALCALTALLCALAPASTAFRSDLNGAMKSTLSDRRNQVFQAFLCLVQVSVTTTLLVTAGLITRSLSNLQTADAGFGRDHVTVFSIDPRVRGYDSQRNWELQQRLIAGVGGLPRVDGVALAGRALMRGIGLGTSVVFPGQGGDGIINTSTNSVSPEYFGVMGIHLLSGRNFKSSDIAEEGKLQRVIVNQAFVKKFLEGRDPIGVQFDTGKRYVRPRYEVIGVVNDTKYRSLREVPPPIYYAYDFGPNAYADAFILHVRSQGDPHSIIEPVRQLLRSLDPELPLFQVATVSEEVEHSLWQERLLAALTSCFGAFALVLAAIGLYGILAYFVVRRKREIGLRLALGANPRHVVGFVLRRVTPVLGSGLLAGAALSWFAGRWVQSLLFGVKPFDPEVNGGTLLLIVAMGLCGAISPVLRALRVEPSSTLRSD